MTDDDGGAWGGTEYAEAAAEVSAQLAARFQGRPLPPDLVITTRSEIEKREFSAYGKGWRDRGEHDRNHRTATQPAASSTDAKVLPFPHPSAPSAARPHPDDDQP
ncbi:hypothetical protein AB0O01_13005 [Streptomyces sp. NPDC093252]|uniref:hypothetical protein n=1 Tax=Streptomyces sp. NPDC093252 TaxID=3154980 RepID=UPI0034475A4F